MIWVRKRAAVSSSHSAEDRMADFALIEGWYTRVWVHARLRVARILGPDATAAASLTALYASLRI